jgi:hypothetical protein
LRAGEKDADVSCRSASKRTVQLAQPRTEPTPNEMLRIARVASARRGVSDDSAEPLLPGAGRGAKTPPLRKSPSPPPVRSRASPAC